MSRKYEESCCDPDDPCNGDRSYHGDIAILEIDVPEGTSHGYACLPGEYYHINSFKTPLFKMSR